MNNDMQYARIAGLSMDLQKLNNDFNTLLTVFKKMLAS